MAAMSTLVPVASGNWRHDFEVDAFYAVGAADEWDSLGHKGSRMRSCFLSKRSFKSLTSCPKSFGSFSVVICVQMFV